MKAFRAGRAVGVAGAVVLAVAGVGAEPAWAWGPHTEIGRAAVRVLPDAAAGRRLYGDRWDKLPPLGFLADWGGEFRPDRAGGAPGRRGPRATYFADDYLLFPGFPRHSPHLMPAVRETYGPFLRRAVQAARTETPANAARWAGALLHFVEDSGSPPHADPVLGAVHTKMENWVDGRAVDVAGYRPRLLGETVDEAVAGLELRMQELVAFSRERAPAIRAAVEGRDERADQPLALECANETARVTADVLRTLVELGSRPAAEAGGLSGRVAFASGVPGAAAKVMLAGTGYSTLTDAEGRYALRGLPEGPAEVIVTAFGCETKRTRVEVAAGARLDVSLAADAVAGNRFRDASLSCAWCRGDRPDDWSAGRLNGGPAQESPWTLLPDATGARVRVRAAAAPEAALRSRRNPREAHTGEDLPLTWRSAGDGVFEAEAVFTLPPANGGEGVSVRLLLAGEGDPRTLVRHIAVTPLGAAAE